MHPPHTHTLWRRSKISLHLSSTIPQPIIEVERGLDQREGLFFLEQIWHIALLFLQSVTWTRRRPVWNDEKRRNRKICLVEDQWMSMQRIWHRDLWEERWDNFVIGVADKVWLKPGFATKSDSNRAVQRQRMVCGFKSKVKKLDR